MIWKQAFLTTIRSSCWLLEFVMDKPVCVTQSRRLIHTRLRVPFESKGSLKAVCEEKFEVCRVSGAPGIA